MLSTVIQDVIFAVRQFRRNRGFTVTVVLTLAISIGATSAIFTLINGVLLQPLPFPQNDRLVAIDTLEFPSGEAATDIAAANPLGTSYPNFFDWQHQNHTFESLASCDPVPRLFSKLDGRGARVMDAARVSANLFSTLGIAPMLGRTFTTDEEQAGHRVVILSHELWVSDFASSPDAVGQTVKISDELSTIVGVMPSGFNYPIGLPARFWTTFAADNEGRTPNTSLRSGDRLSIVGRLRAKVGVKEALADLNTVQRQLAQHYSEDRYRYAVSIKPLLEATVSDVRSALSLLFGAVGIVLLIGCANVAGLLLTRANGRLSEMALRIALGASRGRIVRQLLAEALLLGVAGGCTSVLIAFMLLRAGIRYIPPDVPRIYNISIDTTVLIFTALISGGTALVFGLLPALRMSRLDPMNGLREQGLTTTSVRRSNWLHQALVVAETALSFCLLIGSGLLIRSMVNVLFIEPGFDARNTVAFDIALTNARYPDPNKVSFYDKLLPQLTAVPGIQSVSYVQPLPLGWPSSSWADFAISGRISDPDHPMGAIAAVIGSDYFETLRIPLISGRTFTAHDNDPKSAPVAIVNQSFVQRFFGGENPIGHYLVPEFDRPSEHSTARTIVGVVANTRTGDSSDPYQPEFFLPYAQDPFHQRPLVVLRVIGDPLSYENDVRRVVSNVDGDTPVFRYRALIDDIGLQAAQPRFEAVLVSGFAVIALLLAAVGLYAVLSYIVIQRTREIGLRMALGASRSNILQLVLRRALFLSVIGVGLGALASAFCTTLITDMLFRVTPLDRSVYLTVTFFLILVSVMAALIPAVRAVNVNPVRTLKQE